MASSDGHVDLQEMLEVCEDIIRNGQNAQARLTAMRQLRWLRSQMDEEVTAKPAKNAAPTDDFAALDQAKPRLRRVS
jgi:uncharacterized membrane protein YebE (DUF533 family)